MFPQNLPNLHCCRVDWDLLNLYSWNCFTYNLWQREGSSALNRRMAMFKLIFWAGPDIFTNQATPWHLPFLLYFISHLEQILDCDRLHRKCPTASQFCPTLYEPQLVGDSLNVLQKLELWICIPHSWSAMTQPQTFCKHYSLLLVVRHLQHHNTVTNVFEWTKFLLCKYALATTLVNIITIHWLSATLPACFSQKLYGCHS